jgi:ATP-dependent RNA helicase DDX46/PRP5
MRERRTYKTGDEGDEEEEKDEKTKQADEERFNKALSAVQSAAAPAAPPAPLAGVPKGIDLDGKITVHKTEKDPNAASNNPLAKVGSAVADIHARLSKAGVMRSGVPIDNRGPDAGAFHATLEINDFPRKFSLNPIFLLFCYSS